MTTDATMTAIEELPVGTAEIARMLGITKPTVRRMADEGRIPHYRMGSIYRFKKSEVLNEVRRETKKA